MPYINENARGMLDKPVDALIEELTHGNELSPEELLQIAGEINYSFSRIIAGCMGTVSYKKIAVITGVLENIKQEYYRRIAVPYEDEKIIENGDIKGY
jgi:hypothetical protein